MGQIVYFLTFPGKFRFQTTTYLDSVTIMETFKRIQVKYVRDVEEIADMKTPKRRKIPKNSTFMTKRRKITKVDCNLESEPREIKKSAADNTAYEELFFENDINDKDFGLKLEVSNIEPRFDGFDMDPQVPLLSNLPMISSQIEREMLSEDMSPNQVLPEVSPRILASLLSNPIEKSDGDEVERKEEILFEENVTVEYIHEWKSNVMEDIMD